MTNNLYHDELLLPDGSHTHKLLAQDTHIHTTCSDSDMGIEDTLLAIIKAKESVNIRRISFTDHDTFNAYSKQEAISLVAALNEGFPRHEQVSLWVGTEMSLPFLTKAGKVESIHFVAYFFPKAGESQWDLVTRLSQSPIQDLFLAYHDRTNERWCALLSKFIARYDDKLPMLYPRIKEEALKSGVRLESTGLAQGLESLFFKRMGESYPQKPKDSHGRTVCFRQDVVRFVADLKLAPYEELRGQVGKGGACHIPKSENIHAGLEEGLRVVNDFDSPKLIGIAHPWRYARFLNPFKFIRALSQIGYIGGVEVFGYHEHKTRGPGLKPPSFELLDEKERVPYQSLARRLGLTMLVGSDFHGTAKHGNCVGAGLPYYSRITQKMRIETRAYAGVR